MSTALAEVASTAEAGTAVRRGPGRPRDEDLDAQILDATLALIDAGEPVTVGRIVARSGVSRADAVSPCLPMRTASRPVTAIASSA